MKSWSALCDWSALISPLLQTEPSKMSALLSSALDALCILCFFFLSFFFNARLSHHFNKSQNESFLISLYVFKATESPGMRMKKGQIDRRLTLTGIGINCFTRRKQHPVLNKGVHHVLMFLFMAPAKIILNSQARQSERKCLECAVEAN